jgi:hypothetical protein
MVVKSDSLWQNQAMKSILLALLLSAACVPAIAQPWGQEMAAGDVTIIPLRILMSSLPPMLNPSGAESYVGIWVKSADIGSDTLEVTLTYFDGSAKQTKRFWIPYHPTDQKMVPIGGVSLKAGGKLLSVYVAKLRRMSTEVFSFEEEPR